MSKAIRPQTIFRLNRRSYLSRLSLLNLVDLRKVTNWGFINLVLTLNSEKRTCLRRFWRKKNGFKRICRICFKLGYLTRLVSRIFIGWNWSVRKALKFGTSHFGGFPHGLCEGAPHNVILVKQYLVLFLREKSPLNCPLTSLTQLWIFVYWGPAPGEQPWHFILFVKVTRSRSFHVGLKWLWPWHLLARIRITCQAFNFHWICRSA